VELQILPKSGLVLSETIEKYAETRVGKLDRYLPSISAGKLEISREDVKLPEQRFAVQVTLDSKGVLIRAQERAADIRTAIDKVVDVLTSRIERYKGRLYDRGKGFSLARKGIGEEPQTGEAPKRVVKTKHLLLKPMSIDEAIDQMELIGHDFFLFTNADTGRSNLLYRRRDGDYGLIEPELE